SGTAAVVLATYAMFTNELGLLVWVALVAAYLAGFRGVPLRAVAIVTAILCVYFYLRFVRLSVGAPGLVERSSGFGFSIRSPQELGRMFAAHPLPFYAYNVVASALAVLLSEPSRPLRCTPCWRSSLSDGRFDRSRSMRTCASNRTRRKPTGSFSMTGCVAARSRSARHTSVTWPSIFGRK